MFCIFSSKNNISKNQIILKTIKETFLELIINKINYFMPLNSPTIIQKKIKNFLQNAVRYPRIVLQIENILGDYLKLLKTVEKC